MNSRPLESDNFDDFTSELQGAALKATRNALALPSDIGFHRSMDTDFSQNLDIFSSRVLNLTNRLLALLDGKGKLNSQDDVLDSFHSLVVDSMDQVFERTDTCLDQFYGRNKAPAIAINPAVPKPQLKKAAVEPVIQHAAHIQKPQLSFRTPVDNSDRPWYPILSHKFNAQVPLGYHLRDSDAESSSKLNTKHPYYYEIRHIDYPSRIFETSSPIPVKPFDETPFHWISNVADLEMMLDKLRTAKELAIDLEHHDYRTFAGFLCLMQISTREEDFIVDTLLLRDELQILNEVFTNPGITKVLHGAESDIVWLQQNFNLYIVNLFDTYHASKVLDFPRHGLAQLLEMYCDFTPDKRYQLADWRIRPLPDDMLHYARSDTHFLLFVYDNLRNALLDRSQSRTRSRSGSPSGPTDSSPSSTPATALVRQVLTRSEETSLNVYQREPYDAEGGTGSTGWDSLARKWNKVSFLASANLEGAAALQREVYKAVHAWRDKVAREEDESTRYVLANHFLFKLAEQPPADMAALLRIFPSMPPIIKKRAKELVDAIRDCVKTQLEPTVAKAAAEDLDKTDIFLMETPTSKPLVSGSQDPLGLWSTSHPNIAVAPGSSLFGPSLLSAPKVNPLPVFSTSSSSLFGSIRNASPSVATEISRFKDVVSRIHSSLVIATPVPKIDQARNIQEVPEPPPSEVLAMEVEIPFIPASQRQPKEVIDDSIVVVGQSKQKKRKRVKNTVEEATVIEESEDMISLKNTKRLKKAKKAKEPVDTEGFDFDSAPNILDAAPAVEAETVKPAKKDKKNKKRDKGGGSSSGNFPAPPRPHSQLRSGNKSSTFK